LRVIVEDDTSSLDEAFSSGTGHFIEVRGAEARIALRQSEPFELRGGRRRCISSIASPLGRRVLQFRQMNLQRLQPNFVRLARGAGVLRLPAEAPVMLRLED